MKERRLAILLSIINLILISLLLFQGNTMPPSSSDIVRARLLEVLDENGTVRAQIKVESNPDAVVLRLRDAKGDVRVKLGADERGSGMVLSNGSSDPGLHLLSKTDNVKITLTDKNGQQRVITPE